ncbi:tachylectin-related carbohydrate-binding protein [uncultured Chitinophaga sp.]|jgi:hypothetical protein|uniref:tachylectin-related carbohydrate-binding protein n=1 Tax=uncultured Chitinophaga sp. TaxID=339340 RepID=UPI00260474CD|nr:tachylectin-related carbohydrate-binding protein [uncultured Chitinophaga sp.]
MKKMLLTALFMILPFIQPLLYAQSLFKVTIPGRSFSLVGSASQAVIDDVADGRRFRGKPAAKLVLSAKVPLPPAAKAAPNMQQLTLHFRTSRSGPSLRKVELRYGSSTRLRIQTHLSGDFTKSANSNNRWSWNPPGAVAPGTLLQLEVIFPTGIDSQIDPGELVLTSAVMEYPLKAASAGDRVMSNQNNNAPVANLPAGSGASNGIIYAVADNKNLMWYHHTGRDNDAISWATDGRAVGVGWDFKQVFPGENGVIYAIKENGDLLWYGHAGHGNGSNAWVAGSGNVVGIGWDFPHVFSGGDGVIYAVKDNGDLLWYKHTGHKDGSANWAAGSGNVVGTGWTAKHVFSGGDGVIYLVKDNDELLWYRHTGRGNGSFNWAAGSGKTIGTGWGFKQVFSDGGGVIYAVNPKNELLWSRHDGYLDGGSNWAAPQPKKVGEGWGFKTVFAR